MANGETSNWGLAEWCAFYSTLNSKEPPPAMFPTANSRLPMDTIGESARNRFGRPYISGRPLLACDRRRIVEMYSKGARKITIARAIGVTHSCVSKVIRRFEETGDFENKGSRTASCACPGEADAHDPAICRHVKFRNELLRTAREERIETKPKVFSVEWILSDECHPKRSNGLFSSAPIAPTLNRLV